MHALTLASAALTLFFYPGQSIEQTFDQPIDAVSIGLHSEADTASVSYLLDGTWSTWEEVSVDNEQDPLLKESDLVMFPEKVSKIRIKADHAVTVHPVRISDAPVMYNVAALGNTDAPTILSREEWGADESMLFKSPASVSSSGETGEETGGNGTGQISERVDSCAEAQLNYPDEFKIARTEKTDGKGNTYRWAHQYSKDIDLIAVHHTAVKVAGDKRSGIERIRALYAYHANNRGWGDIGYHYLIDEDGQIYEGKSGGKYVIGGHAYCNNTNTLGVALLGNLEEEKPTQEQLKALQWLLKDLTDTYKIDPAGTTQSHGRTLPTIVGHRDVVSTTCPGFYVYGSLAQIRSHVTKDDVYASIKLPTKPGTIAKKTSSSRKSTVVSGKKTTEPPPTYATGKLSRAAQRALQNQGSIYLRYKLRTGADRRDGASTVAVTSSKSSVTSRKTIAQQASSRSSIKTSSKSTQSSKSSVRSSRQSSSSSTITASETLRVRLTRQETGATNCDAYPLDDIRSHYRGTISCTVVDGIAAIINTVSLEDYMLGLAEEPDSEPYEKQRAFAIAARTYAAYYMNPSYRKFPNKPYDGSDSPATFQKYMGKDFEGNNPRWLKAVEDTAHEVLTIKGEIIRAPYFSGDDGRTRSPAEAGWKNFPFAEVFVSKEDPWCKGDTLRGHGVGMSGCGAEGQANEGKSGEDILAYYYPGTVIHPIHMLQTIIGRK